MDRLCTRCQQRKPSSEFYGGTHAWCKECRRQYTRERWRTGHPAKSKAPPGQKRCPMCRRVLPVEEFRRRVASGAPHAYCRPCERERNETARRKGVSDPRGPLGTQWASWRTTGWKWCSGCKRSKPLAAFSWNKAKGLAYAWCRKCSGRAHARWIRTQAGRAAQRRDAAKRSNSYKGHVRRFTTEAIALGLLVRRPCVRCGAAKSEAHHPDYSKPLEVVWLCGCCHRQEHGAIGDTE